MNRAQHPQRLRTARGDDRTTNKALRARGAIRHHHTAIQGALKTTLGAPCHSVQNPANIGKPAGVGEALRPQGKGGSPTYATSAAVGQADVARKRQKPRRLTSGRGSSAKLQAPEEEHGTRLKTSAALKIPQTPQTKLHRWSRTGIWSQKSCITP